MIFKSIDLCSGIGGIRRGFEITKACRNILSAEIDPIACKVYKHLYGTNPLNDITSTTFKKKVSKLKYDILLAGFPCQTFSRAGKKEGFNNTVKGTIFFDIVDIIRSNRPKCIFLENVDHLINHNQGKTFRTIIDTLVSDLNYSIIGVSKDKDGHSIYNSKDFIRNSKDFGIPQNRPRVYIVGFDNNRYQSKLEKISLKLPIKSSRSIYKNLNVLLDKKVDAKFFMSEGYLKTLEKHAIREKQRGNGFGYKIVNAKDIKNPIANTIMATGGAGKERNLIYDEKMGKKYSGTKVKNKLSVINSKNIRVMTPSEWGKLQGFINYGFMASNGKDMFSFPEGISDNQKYKLFGNAVTIPVIEHLAYYVLNILRELERKDK